MEQFRQQQALKFYEKHGRWPNWVKPEEKEELQKVADKILGRLFKKLLKWIGIV